MPKKRPGRSQAEQLVFPFALRVGDVVLDEGERLEVIERPVSYRSGKVTRVVVRNATAGVRQEIHWDAWRKLRVVRAA